MILFIVSCKFQNHPFFQQYCLALHFQSLIIMLYTTVRFIKPYLNPVYKCTEPTSLDDLITP